MVASLRLFPLSDEHAVRFRWTKGSASKTTRVEVPYYGEAIGELHAPQLHAGSPVALYVNGEQVPSMFVVGMFVNDRSISEPLLLFNKRQGASEYTFAVIMAGIDDYSHLGIGPRCYYHHHHDHLGFLGDLEERDVWRREKNHCWKADRYTSFCLPEKGEEENSQPAPAPVELPAAAPAPVEPPITAQLGRVDLLEEAHLTVVIAATYTASHAEDAACGEGTCRVKLLAKSLR